MSNETAPVITAGARTPHGRYGGSLRDLPVVDIASDVAGAALERAGVSPLEVDEVIFSNCRQAGNGPNPSRQVAIKAGVRLEVPAQTINMACASGMKAVQLAVQSVQLGTADVVLVVAAEAMSRMPYLASHELRWQGARRGDITLIDGWRDGGTDPICGMGMGETAENIARAHGITREAQDAWALRSHRRAAEAWREGRFEDEVVPVERDGVSLREDETHRLDTTAEKLASLSAAFVKDGTVTAGNSSQMADGAAALVVMSAKAATSEARSSGAFLRGFAAVGVDPTQMGVGPAHAIPRALKSAGLSDGDIDLYEINEAFGAQIVHNIRELELDEAIVNVNGGGIALGHPTGQSGTRIIVTLLHELQRRGEVLGVASLCVGGGQGIAAVLERCEDRS